MRFDRKRAVALLAILWAVVLYAMYSVLYRLGPLDPEKVPGFPRYDGDPLAHSSAWRQPPSHISPLPWFS
jgi:hypothetical protein